MYHQVVDLWPEADTYLDGLAVHWYLNKEVPPSVYTLVNNTGKFIISTEACSGKGIATALWCLSTIQYYTYVWDLSHRKISLPLVNLFVPSSRYLDHRIT